MAKRKPKKIKVNYVQLEAAAFLSDEDFQMMTDAERGIYTTIIFYMLCNNGRIKNDKGGIKRLCNSDDKFDNKWAVVMRKFYQKGAWLRHRRVDYEIKKAKKRLQDAVKAGLKGAEAKWRPHSDPINNPVTKGREGKLYNIYTYTEQQFKDLSIQAGVTEQEAIACFHYYNKKNFVDKDGNKITEPLSALVNWRIQRPRFKEKNDGRDIKRNNKKPFIR